MIKGKNKSAEGYSKKQWDALRDHIKKIKDDFGGYDQLGKKIGVKGNTILSFVLGRSKGLSEETLKALEANNLLPDLSSIEQENKPVEPLASYNGEVKTIAEAAKEKGYSPATMRKYCRMGKLHYIMKGKRMMVAIDELYESLRQTELGRLRSENQSLKEQVKEFEFILKMSANMHHHHDSNARLLMIADERVPGCNFSTEEHKSGTFQESEVEVSEMPLCKCNKENFSPSLVEERYVYNGKIVEIHESFDEGAWLIVSRFLSTARAPASKHDSNAHLLTVCNKVAKV